VNSETPTPHRDAPPPGSGSDALSDHDPSRPARTDASRTAGPGEDAPRSGSRQDLGDFSRYDPADALPASPGGYALLYSAVDGWELYQGDELLAGHDGIEAGDVDHARAWAAGQLANGWWGGRVAVTGWTTRPHRYDPAGSVEHVAGVAARPAPQPPNPGESGGCQQPAATRYLSPSPQVSQVADRVAAGSGDATQVGAATRGATPADTPASQADATEVGTAGAGFGPRPGPAAGLPPLPELLAELAGLDKPAGRVHEVIRTLGGAPVAVQQEYRDALCPTYLRPSDWKSALAEAKQAARDARRAASRTRVDDDDQADDGTPPGDGAEVLDAVAGWIGPHLALPSPHYLPVLVLWAAHTHAAGAFYVTPRLVLDSAEPASGKTRVLELLNLVCRRPELILSPTTAAIFRMLADGPFTLLFDEVDAIFNPKSAGNHEDLRALLNAGYKRGATIPRCVGDAATMKVERFKVFAPVALAGLAGNGTLPATILTRAVVLHIRKRPAHQKVKPFVQRDAEAEAEPIRAALRRWVRHQAPGLELARPKMPDGVEDRPAEVWEALLAIADAAGGHWPDTARAACEHFVLNTGPAAPSLGVRLLADLRRVFGNADKLPTTEVLDKLTALDEAPWADLNGKPIDSRRLARELKRYEVAPVPFEGPCGKTARGYTTYAVDIKGALSAGLADAWSRYLSPEAAPERKERKERKDPGQDAGRNEPDNVRDVRNVSAQQDPLTSLTSAHVTAPATAPTLTSGLTPITSLTPNPGSRTDTPPAGDRCPDCAEPYDSIDHQINCEGLDAPEGTTP
jgi:hypothetical protein